MTHLAHDNDLNLEVALWSGVPLLFWEPEPGPGGIILTPERLVICMLSIVVEFRPQKDGTRAGLLAAYSFGVPLTRRGQSELEMVEFKGVVVRAANESAFIAVRLAV